MPQEGPQIPQWMLDLQGTSFLLFPSISLDVKLIISFNFRIAKSSAMKCTRAALLALDCASLVTTVVGSTTKTTLLASSLKCPLSLIPSAALFTMVSLSLYLCGNNRSHDTKQSQPGSAPRIFSPYQPVLWHEYEAEHDNGFVNISMDDFVDDQCSALLADDSHQLQSFNYDDSDEEFDDDDDHLSQQARARAKANSMPMVYSSMQEQSMMLPPTSSLAPHAEFRYYPEPSAFKSEFVNSSPSPVIATSVDDDSSWYYNHNTNRPSPSSLRQIEVSPQSTSLPASSLSVPNSWSDSASTCSSWSRPSSSPSSPLEPLHNDNSVAESGDLFLDLSTSAMNIPLGQQQQQQYQAYPREVPSASLSLQHLQQQIPQQELDELNSVLLSGSSSTTLEAYLRTMLSPSDKAADGGLAYSNQNLNNHPRKLQQQSFAPMPMLQPETGTEMLYYMNTNMTY